MHDTGTLSMPIQTMLAFAITDKGITTGLDQQHVRKIFTCHHPGILIVHHVWSYDVSHNLRGKIRLFRMIDDGR